VNVSLTLSNTTIWFVAALSLVVDVQMYGQTFLPGLLIIRRWLYLHRWLHIPCTFTF